MSDKQHPKPLRLPDDEERLIRRDPDAAEYLRDPERLNSIAQELMDGYSTASPADIHTYLIAALRCEGDLWRETRNAIADALDRGRAGAKDHPIGRGGEPMPLLRVECAEGVGRAAIGLLSAERKMEAAEALVEYREETGVRGDRARDHIRSLYEISDADLKSGTLILNAFKREIENRFSSFIRGVCAAHDLGVFDKDRLYHYRLARLEFLKNWSENKREKRRSAVKDGGVES